MRHLLSVIGVARPRHGGRGRAAARRHEREASRRAPAPPGLPAVVKAELAVLRGPRLARLVGADDRPRLVLLLVRRTDAGGASCRGCRLEGERRGEVDRQEATRP